MDLDAVTWRRGWGYDRDELSRLYTGADVRARLVLQEVHRRVADPARMRALAFCVSVEHARYMATRFEEAGLASAAVTGATPGPERDAAIQRLEAGKLQALFTVARTSTVLLFVRETQEQPNGVAEPYWFLGPVTLESAAGERPMQIVWRLERPMPGHLYQRATLAAG